MNSNYCSLQSLDTDTKDCKIKVRVSRIWKSINLRNNETFATNMLLIDEEGYQLVAVVPKFLMNKFELKVAEGLVFEISNFSIKNQKQSYQVVEKQYNIEFRANTCIKKVFDAETRIPEYKFVFFPLDKIESQYGNNTYLLDVIDKLCSVSNIVEVTKFDELKSKSLKRDIIIANSSGREIRITLWEDLAKQCNEEDISNIKGTIVIIVTSTIVRNYGGAYFLQSTNASKMHINLEVPEVATMLTRYKLNMQIEDESGVVDLVAFEKEAENLLKYTVKELTELESQENGKEKIASIFGDLVGTKILFQIKKTDYCINNWEKRKLTANKIQRVIADQKAFNTIKENIKEIKSELCKSKRTMEEDDLVEDMTVGKRNCIGLE